MMKQKFVISIQIFIAHVKANDIYKHIAKDFETRFGTLNYELNRGLTREKSKKYYWCNERLIRWKNHETFC